MIDNGTVIGRPNVTGKIYTVLVEYRAEEDNGLNVDVVCETQNESTAQLVLNTLNEMLTKGIFDISTVMDFFIDEEDMEDNTVVADSLLASLLTADKRYEEGMDDPIRALLKLIYAWENQE